MNDYRRDRPGAEAAPMLGFSHFSYSTARPDLADLSNGAEALIPTIRGSK